VYYRIKLIGTLSISALLLSGCLVRTAADVVTAPIKAGGALIDAATTSQAEADRNRGRAIRRQEEREARELKKAEKEARRRARQEQSPDY
jgi:hypothetical protein